MVNKLKRKIFKLIILFFSIIFCICVYYKWKENTFETTFYELDSKKIHENIRIVNLSDLHLKEFGKNNENLVEKIKELSPDIITISGDMVNKDNADFSVDYKLCRQLIKIAPTYYSLGNHEYEQLLFKKHNIIPNLKKIGVQVLNDEYKTITVKHTEIDICGCTQHNHNYDKYAKEYMNQYMNSKKFKLLLVHYPELFLNQLKNSKIDLALCGHEHGGQIIIPFIGPLYSRDQGFFPKMAAGEYKQKYGTVIVNRGLGTHDKIPRINNIPEIVVIDIS